ncbi:GTP 3',8-cyclase MoaA [Kitasatospora sp. NPDC001175]|uniref:GTP 3',8-cyclase MoaA n=1 Tax=Kitasatospora sp. NPDC001175 TaxID=3157103 RepID=UPI003D077035
MLLDTFGRQAVDLRVSLTDRCDLRCTYCMPEQGMTWLAKPTLLTDEEVVRLVRIAVTLLGVREVRFTGGEPLLRPGLVGILTACARLQPRPELSLTTNGIGLARTAAALRGAGLDRVNVSLDTLDPRTFQRLSRRDRHHDVLAGLTAARAAGLSPIKVNTVLMRGINDHEAPDLLAWCLERGYELRFIEQMPLDPQHGWDRSTMVTAAEILDRLSTRFTVTPEPAGRRGSAPAERWIVDGGPARVGVIASVTQPFCRACDRTRLTADGQVRNCLFATGETDLRTALREGGDDPRTDARIAELWRAAMWGKKAGGGIGDPDFHQPERPMSAIGG